MQHRLILPLLCCFAGFSSAALATPITLSKTNAVADSRRDAGTGICGSFIHYKVQSMPVNLVKDAADLLNKPPTDPNILARKSTLLDNLNFRNGDSSAGADFTIPMYIDQLFPYSNNQMAMPPGDDNNIAARIRGYLNVTNTLGGSPVTFAVNCDDFCSLSIGKQVIIPIAHEQISARVTQQVVFKDAGLYPVEMVYAQNASQAYLEVSRALSAEPEGNQNASVDLTKFKLIPGTEMYSAIVGSNPSCQECGAPGQDCSSGNYCGDGLCQVCNLPDHCGPTCKTCPANARLCNAGNCVECTSDDMCPSGETCNNGTCGPPVICTNSSMCPATKVCDPDTGFCVVPPPKCATDAECPAGQICDKTKGYCIVKPTPCTSDTQCLDGWYCDTSEMLCKRQSPILYEGGLQGCTMSTSPRNSGQGLALLGLLGLALFGLSARMRRRVVAEGQVTHIQPRRYSVRRSAMLLLPVFFLRRS